MNERVYIPPTKRRAMTKARATRIFVARDGICFICRNRIRVGADEWFVEHPDTVEGGGSDDDADLWPAHYKCKPVKDAVDAGNKARRDRLVTKGFRDMDKHKRGALPGTKASGWRKRMDGTVERRE